MKREIKKLLVYSTRSTIDMIPDMETLQMYKKQKPRTFDYHFVIFPDGTLEMDVPLSKVCKHGNPEADNVAITVGVVGGMVAAPTREEPDRLVPGETLTPEQRDMLVILLEQQMMVARQDGVDLQVLGCDEINLEMEKPGFDVGEILRSIDN